MNRRGFLKSGLVSVGGLAAGGTLFAASDARGARPSVAGSADVIVAGGGPAGISAAVSFARRGKRVILLETHGCLGGIWTSGLLSLVIDFGRSQLANEITRRLEALGARFPRRAVLNDANYLYEPEYMKFVCEELCREAGVRFQLHTSVVAVETDGRNVVAVETESKSGRQRWTAPLFVDATGDGDLAARASCGFERGGDVPGDSDQPASLMALAVAEDGDGLAPFVVNDSRQFGDDGRSVANAKLAFLQELRRVGVDPSYSAPSLFRVRRGLFALMANHEYGVPVDDAAAITAATIRARRELITMARALETKGGSVWRGFRIVATAEQLGHRGARRIHGRYTLTRKDVLEGRRFDDAIAACGFCIDIHTTRREDRRDGVVVTDRGTDADFVQPVYQIPLRACRAKDLDNLYMVGRCISGDFGAQASYRITGAAVAMGEGLARMLTERK